jgi:hypothetical protein
LAVGTEAKIVTGLDDHSRYCVICQVVVRATGRAVCLAFAAALQKFGVPELPRVFRTSELVLFHAAAC